MAIELSSDSAICFRCGTKYGKRRGYFQVTYSNSYKGVGYLHICKNCVDKMYATYLEQSKDPKAAVRQMCRKLDLYWNEEVFNFVMVKNTTRSVISAYITKIGNNPHVGKSYDDTLAEEKVLWTFDKVEAAIAASPPEEPPKEELEYEPLKEVVEFWGAGYSNDMYRDLEQRRQVWMSKLPQGAELDIGSEALIRQICNLEVSIARDSAAGKPIDKSANSLNTLLGSLNIKPSQQKATDADADLASTPLGVWLYRYENKRPLPEVDESLKDVNHIKKYVMTWLGHVCRMLGVKNTYTKLYDEEIERLRVEHPEYSDEDDEDLMIDSYSEGDSDE